MSGPRAEPPTPALPPVIGHRGAAGLAPENTLPGLEAAAAAGCRWVEVDVMLAGCGTPVLHHDVSLKRVEGVADRLDRLPYDRLAALDAGAWFDPRFAGTRIPTLTEALEAMLRLGLHPNLEIKPAPGAERATAEATVRAVRAAWPGDRPAPLLSSFRRTSLTAARDAAPDLPLGLIAERRPQRWRQALRELGCRTLHLAAGHLDPGEVRAVREAGWPVAVYTVNDPALAGRFRAWGVDAVITDRPDLMPADL